MKRSARMSVHVKALERLLANPQIRCGGRFPALHALNGMAKKAEQMGEPLIFEGVIERQPGSSLAVFRFKRSPVPDLPQIATKFMKEKT